MNPDDYEKLPTNNVTTNMCAGAIAGIMEHCVMYPLDSVKTRMQSLTGVTGPAYRGIGEALVRMIRQEGMLRPVRGMSAVVVGAGPAHALYFSCYEYSRDKLTHSVPHASHFMPGIAGSLAALLHDGVMNPAEVVKQRLQVFNSPYKSCLDCIRQVYQTEGIGAFYRSYTTQLTMNIPFQCIHFMSYEFMQNWTNMERSYNPAAHMVSGAVAGAIAAAATTPLDVCKTLLNTQEAAVSGLVAAAKTVYRLKGMSGYFRGLKARVLYQMPSTAICWSTYEFFKYIMKKRPIVEAELLLPSVETEAIRPWEEISISPISSPSPAALTTASSPSPIPTITTSPATAGLYGALAFNTVHHHHDSSLHNSTLLDVSPISRS